MKTQRTFFKADQDRFGSIRIKKNSYIVKYLQFECEINWFFDQLENHEKNIINEGFETGPLQIEDPVIQNYLMSLYEALAKRRGGTLQDDILKQQQAS